MFVLSEIFAGNLGPVAQNLVRAIFLPLHYFLAGGVFFVGSLLFWRRAGRTGSELNPVARVLAYSAIASLIVGSFFQSVVVNNDLGWRVVLFVQLAALLWTAALLEPLWHSLQRHSLKRVVAHAPRILTGTLLLGYGAVAHDLLATRLFPAYGKGVIINPRDPAADFEARDVYGWINRNLGSRIVVQHNPDTERALGYGLYGRQRTARADKHNALLFGPSNSEVAARLDVLKPVFASNQSALSVSNVLNAQHIDAVVVSSQDPVWKLKAAWVFATPALYQTPNLRVLSVRDLKDHAP